MRGSWLLFVCALDCTFLVGLFPMKMATFYAAEEIIDLIKGVLRHH